MKKHTGLHNALLFLALVSLPFVGEAKTGHNGEIVEKKRTINKSYSVSDKDKLSIENSFGNIVVNTWDKSEIKVDIEIGVKASTEQKAQAMMNQIDVHDSQSDNVISFKTDVNDVNNNDGKKHKNLDYGDDRKFYIDYKIYMPIGNKLDIENSFGKISVPDLQGAVSLTSKFGELNAGKLSEVRDIDVEFGKAEIAAIHDGDISFKFNSRSHINQVSGSVKIKSEFSGDVRFDVANSIQDLSLIESYSSISMLVGKDISAQFTIHSSFGSFHNGTAIQIEEDKDEADQFGPKFDRDYSGTSGDGKAKIKVKSSFGKIRFYDSGSAVNNDNDDDDDKDTKHHSKKTVSL